MIVPASVMLGSEAVDDADPRLHDTAAHSVPDGTGAAGVMMAPPPPAPLGACASMTPARGSSRRRPRGSPVATATSVPRGQGYARWHRPWDRSVSFRGGKARAIRAPSAARRWGPTGPGVVSVLTSAFGQVTRTPSTWTGWPRAPHSASAKQSAARTSVSGPTADCTRARLAPGRGHELAPVPPVDHQGATTHEARPRPPPAHPPAVALRVDHPHAGSDDGDVVDVGPAPRDGTIVEDETATTDRLTQQVAHLLLGQAPDPPARGDRRDADERGDHGSQDASEAPPPPDRSRRRRRSYSARAEAPGRPRSMSLAGSGSLTSVGERSRRGRSCHCGRGDRESHGSRRARWWPSW